MQLRGHKSILSSSCGEVWRAAAKVAWPTVGEQECHQVDGTGRTGTFVGYEPTTAVRVR